MQLQPPQVLCSMFLLLFCLVDVLLVRIVFVLFLIFFLSVTLVLKAFQKLDWYYLHEVLDSRQYLSDLIHCLWQHAISPPFTIIITKYNTVAFVSDSKISKHDWHITEDWHWRLTKTWKTKVNQNYLLFRNTFYVFNSVTLSVIMILCCFLFLLLYFIFFFF